MPVLSWSENEMEQTILAQRCFQDVHRIELSKVINKMYQLDHHPKSTEPCSIRLVYVTVVTCTNLKFVFIKQTHCTLKCFLFHILQIKRRFIINLPAFRVRIVDKDGIHELPTIKPQVSVRSIPSESL